MTQRIQYFCDICDKECFVKEGLGTLAGFIMKLDAQLRPQRYAFEGHYCSEHTEEILNFISEKKNAKDNNTGGVGEQVK